MSWYHDVVADISKLPDALEYYEREYNVARSEIKLGGGTLEEHIKRLPGDWEYRFAQLQEIEAILQYLHIELRKIRRKHYKRYVENYDRVLSGRDAEKYVDGEQEVIDQEMLINEVAMIRNLFTGLSKAFEAKSFQINNTQRLRTAGMDDASL